MTNRLYISTLLVLLLAIGCNPRSPVISNWPSYIADHESWQEQRLARLKSERGWLNLAGLFWLEEGANTFGSDSVNNLLFPAHFPPNGGTLTLQDSTLLLEVAEQVDILADGEPVKNITVRHDQQPGTTIMELGSFRWYVIQRGEQYGIRLRDLEHPRLEALEEIPSYPFSKKWVVKATFHPYDSVRKIEVPTVIDNFSEWYDVPGELRFRVNGKMQTLLPFRSGDGFFLIVGDATNGLETYGAGRFLYCGDVQDGKVTIDFNRAYNPPCAFSPFATCPLPPMQNILDIEIDAGERAVHLE